ncbi:MAG: hypothetical protein JSU70_02665 [Phycisphaerales bacterium]|nr:MAG: hypothetical protein JSU70_02665 [Phycisphaerales bacterium]
MKAKDRYQPSETVEALFTTAVVKIKTEADKAIAKQKAMSETEVVSAKAGVQAKTKAPTLEQEVEPEVETETAIEASAITELRTQLVDTIAKLTTAYEKLQHEVSQRRKAG